MTKTVSVAGLQATLAWLQPMLASILGNTLKLSDGVVLNLPDSTSFTFSATDDPDKIRVEFGGITATIDRSALMGIFHMHATEPVRFAEVGPRTVETQVSMFKIVAVDGGD